MFRPHPSGHPPKPPFFIAGSKDFVIRVDLILCPNVRVPECKCAPCLIRNRLLNFKSFHFNVCARWFAGNTTAQVEKKNCSTSSMQPASISEFNLRASEDKHTLGAPEDGVRAVDRQHLRLLASLVGYLPQNGFAVTQPILGSNGTAIMQRSFYSQRPRTNSSLRFGTGAMEVLHLDHKHFEPVWYQARRRYRPTQGVVLCRTIGSGSIPSSKKYSYTRYSA